MLTVAMNQAKPEGATEATVFGPFHVDDAPRFESGADIAAGAPGAPLQVDVQVVSTDGTPIAGADVDVWQADEDGLYDVQVPGLGHRRARGVFRSDAEGRVSFRSIVPTAYPIPTDGPVGRMLVASGRHPWRPAHLHFLIKAPEHETLITHLFRDGDPYLDSDVVFGVRSSLIVPMQRHDGHNGEPATYTLRHRFVLPPL
jgi:hydroxyquinol 1,2-dioxygenase